MIIWRRLLYTIAEHPLGGWTYSLNVRWESERILQRRKQFETPLGVMIWLKKQGVPWKNVVWKMKGSL